MDNINVNQTAKVNRPSRKGPLNPMFGRTHTQQSKEKMSKAATLRNQQYRDVLRNQHHVTMDEFLSNNPSVKEYIKVLAQRALKEEINKLIMRKAR